MQHQDSPTPARRLRWSGHTDRGKVRANNEDAFLGLQFDAREVHHLGRLGEASTGSADFAFAVSDGMGGAKSGEFASRIAVEKITRLLPRSFAQRAIGLAAGVDDVLTELIHQIHGALSHLGESYDECAGMGATLSLCWFTPGWMYFAHVGDSRIYFLPAAGGIRQLSEDDTHVGWLFRNGKINERELRDHPRRNILQKALGAGHQFVDPQLGAVACEPGDTILLCTDGVTDGLFNSQLAERLRNPDAAEAALNPAHRLVEAALACSGRDNATALVIEALDEK
jgi:PPM family protein phosphatase